MRVLPSVLHNAGVCRVHARQASAVFSHARGAILTGRQKTDRTPANYALHYVGGPPRTADGKAQLSGDYFDRFAKVMGEKVAPGRNDYVAILSNGTSS